MGNREIMFYLYSTLSPVINIINGPANVVFNVPLRLKRIRRPWSHLGSVRILHPSPVPGLPTVTDSDSGSWLGVHAGLPSDAGLNTIPSPARGFAVAAQLHWMT